MVFDLKIVCVGDKSTYLEYGSFVFLDPPGMHIKAQSWTALKNFNSLLFLLQYNYTKPWFRMTAVKSQSLA